MNQPSQTAKKTIKIKNKAKERFAKLEMDYEDDKLGFKIQEDSLHNITSNLRSLNLNRLNNIRRFILMVTQNILKGLRFIYVNFCLNVFKASKLFLIKMKDKLKSTEENIQMNIDKILTIKELQEKDQREKIIKDQQMRAQDIVDLKGKIDNLFQGLVETNDFETEVELISFIRFNMEFMLEQMSFIANKLVVSNMLANVIKIDHVTILDQHKMQTRLSFLLDKKGHTWSLMFGKFFIPNLNQNYETKNGKIKMQQVCDLTAGVDVLFLDFESDAIIEEMKTTEEIIEIKPKNNFLERTL